MSIYQLKEYKKPSFLEKILNRTPKVNALIEINNLFSKNEHNLLDIDINSIKEITEKYKLKLGKKYRAQRLDLFKEYLLFSLNDYEIDEKEQIVFNHIKELLYLNDYEINKIIASETYKLYDKEVKMMISKGVLTNQEKDKLEILKDKLLIDSQTAIDILKSNSEKKVSDFIDDIISDERVSDDELVAMSQLAENLEVNIEEVLRTKKSIEKYRLFWLIENGELPKLQPTINILKGEYLHFETKINWLEQRRVTKRVNYSGVSTRIKITKGVYYKVGSYAPKTISEDVWREIDIGTMYLTNKRIIFMGNKGNKTIRLNKVLDIKTFNNGVEIDKDTGKSPFFEFNKNIDVFSMMLLRLMNEQ